MLGSLQSSAELDFRLDDLGRTVLAKRRAGGLFHFSKPYRNGDTLSLQIVNPTAGLFDGDSMELDVHVRAGAQVALTSPSANRFYTMDRSSAKVRQHFTIGAGGWLEYHPNFTVPQRGSAVDQEIRIDLASGAEMIFLDQLSPGRLKHGEQYLYRRFTTSFSLSYDGIPRVAERMVLEPHLNGWPLTVPGWDVALFGAVWLVKDDLHSHLDTLSAIESSIQKTDLHCGLTILSDQVAVIRLLAPRSIILRQALRDIRASLNPIFPNHPFNPRLQQT
ncbi:MAG: urease accessory protein UreD [Verrucomicrobiaceae bacterium]